MSQNRKLPFGYKYCDGRIEPNELEAPYVTKIAQAYVDGNSIHASAQMMSHTGVPYRDDTTGWNKNMIFRILQDQRYAGTDTWPALLRQETISAIASARAARKQSQLSNTDIRSVRSKICCPHCLTRMTRRTSRKQNGVGWYCPTCNTCTEPVSDTDLIDQITQRIDWLRRNADQVTSATPSITLSSEYQRLHRELDRKISDPQNSKEELCTLARQATAELYQCFQVYNYAYESERIRRLLKDSNAGNNAFPAQLFHRIVIRVFPEISTHLTLQLTNQQIV